MMNLDQKELLNQIINHKMLREVLLAEQDVSSMNLNVFTRNQMQEISTAKMAPISELLIQAINIQIAQEEEMFRNMK